MARALKSVEVTTILNEKRYVPLEIFNTFGVPDAPDSIIGNYIKGSGAPMLKVNVMEDMTGAWEFLNPQLIVKMIPKY
ncbi:hypothetical protein QCM8_51 [Bacillus phage QCM8]|nr:hypothetical protein QCM8_51 [Bacillus phage QCM8]UGO47631.1 hypothetical protein MCCARTNEY_43 [Bacillus phage vB_BanH_McCartney]UGO49145.1 hypothetical protein EMILIAHAH_46 [Bacillus phage vB_BanH_Emiliahah]